MSSNKGFNQEVSQEFITQAKTQDPETLKDLYKCYADACFTTAYRLSGDASLAADICHEVFIVMIEKLHSFKGQSVQFGGWMKRIVVNKTINRMKFEMRFTDIDDSPIEHPNTLFTHQWLDSSIDLHQLLEKLSDQHRTVLWLYEIEGYSHAEIASMFNKSVSFSKVTVLRAYRSLQQLSEVSHV
ncbi:MAG: sigma-70 family RNA polymerase sigma factor [Paraglaciecola sp.]|uniref:RNA polymerase sigma factor n=1 Tax=Paraglaciecola sp. TaxID=1920173 RepID=UPI003297ACC4